MDSVNEFFEAKTFAVAGASVQPHKYGNRVFRALIASGRETYPLNPEFSIVEGHRAYPRLADLPCVPDSLSIITPPMVTQTLVADALSAGVKHIWMQPGAEHAEAAKVARKAGINVIDDGSCVLVFLSRQ